MRYEGKIKMPKLSNLLSKLLSKYFLHICVVLLCIFYITGCGSEPQKPFTIGTYIWSGYEPLYLARSMNILDSEKVALVELTSATEVIRAFRNGIIDAAALTLDEVLLLKDYGIDSRVILILDISNGADVIMGQAEIKSMAEAKGKRVGFENTALGSYLLARALQESDLNKNDLTLVPLEVDEHESAFAAGKIDLAVTFEPVRSKLLAQGANILFDSSRIPNEIVDVLVVRPERLEENQKTLKYIVNGWYSALAYLEDEPHRAAEMMKDRMGLSTKEVISSYNGLLLPGKKETLDLLTRGTATSLYTNSKILADIMYTNKLLSKKIDTDVLFDNTIIKAVQ